MLPSLSALEAFPWTRVQATGADQVAQILHYFSNFPNQIEGPKTTYAFWRRRVNELLAEDDIIPDDPAEIVLLAKGYQFAAEPRHPDTMPQGYRRETTTLEAPMNR